MTAQVALPTEGVDRNIHKEIYSAWSAVALPTEGVDRNYPPTESRTFREMVALPTEGVDRNSHGITSAVKDAPSPSPRRAWIEIL